MTAQLGSFHKMTLSFWLLIGLSLQERIDPEKDGAEAGRINVLQMGETLEQGESLWSLNGQYQLLMQGNGNLVGYEGSNPRSPSFWSSETGDELRPHRGQRATMQSDGNFVVFDASGSQSWTSNTTGKGMQVVIQDNSAICVLDKDDGIVWSSMQKACQDGFEGDYCEKMTAWQFVDDGQRNPMVLSFDLKGRSVYFGITTDGKLVGSSTGGSTPFSQQQIWMPTSLPIMPHDKDIGIDGVERGDAAVVMVSPPVWLAAETWTGQTTPILFLDRAGTHGTKPSGQQPKSMVGAAFTGSEHGRGWLFGGKNGTSTLRDWYSVNMKAYGLYAEWQIHEVEPRPPGLFKASMNFLDAQGQGRLLLFGGQKADGVCSDEVWFANLWLLSWRKEPKKISSAWPPGRMRHASTWDPGGKRLFICGGHDGSKQLSDIWAYDVEMRQWKEFKAPEKGIWPSGTFAAAWVEREAEKTLYLVELSRGNGNFSKRIFYHKM